MAVTTRSRAEGRRGLAVVVATGALLLAACGGGEAAAPGADGSLSIATGGTGGVYYPYGGAMGTVLSEKLEGITATAQETNASVDNVLLVQDGGRGHRVRARRHGGRRGGGQGPVRGPRDHGAARSASSTTTSPRR